MAKTYVPSLRWAGPLSAGMIFMLVMLFYAIYQHPAQNSTREGIMTDVGLGLFFVAAILMTRYGISISYDDETFSTIDYFLLRKTFRIKDIVAITYPPTFIV